jgi:Protein of unknown function (DUF2946)
MDDLVLRGMAKWPNVPDVYGWLTLNRRGEWLIKDDVVSNPMISAFVGRNYQGDAQGRWFFQNGPQRVFVTLGYTPHVYRAIDGADGSLELESHTGARPPAISGAWLDENGTLLVETEVGVGVVHDRDLDRVVPAFTDVRGGALADAELYELMAQLQQGEDAPLAIGCLGATTRVGWVRSHQVPERFRFDPSPAPPEGEPECT